ncbi:MAG: response regulator [Gammaproteobacteria bacterium]|nr:response regulator [Gammaproteobacteria bacterium]
MAHILIVDDSPTEVHVLTTMLESTGHTVYSASNGEAGIEMAKELKPTLILMDVVMPGMNGFQATRQLTRDEDTANIPVIIVTTKDQETDRVWGLRQGAKGYVTKPIDETLLMEKIAELVG